MGFCFKTELSSGWKFTFIRTFSTRLNRLLMTYVVSMLSSSTDLSPISLLFSIKIISFKLFRPINPFSLYDLRYLQSCSLLPWSRVSNQKYTYWMILLYLRSYCTISTLILIRKFQTMFPSDRSYWRWHLNTKSKDSLIQWRSKYLLI